MIPTMLAAMILAILPATVLEILRSGNVCPAMALVALLVTIGNHVADEKQRRWGVGLALAAFFLFGAYSWSVESPVGAEELFGLALRSAVAGGLVMGISWMAFPILAVLHRHLFTLPWERAESLARSMRRPAYRPSRDERRPEPDTLSAQLQKEQEEARVRAEAEAKRRREDARAHCELHFQLHAHELGERFSRAVFDDFMKRYMGDDRTPEYIEARSGQLVHSIEQIINTPASRKAQEEAEQKRKQDEERGRHEPERQAAIEAVEAFYAANEEGLREELPPVLLRAHLRAKFPAGMSAEAAWAAARDLIAEMSQTIRQVRERREQQGNRHVVDADRIREIDKAIAAFQAKIQVLRSSNKQPDLIEDEVSGLQGQIRRLEQQKEQLLNPGN